MRWMVGWVLLAGCGSTAPSGTEASSPGFRTVDSRALHDAGPVFVIDVRTREEYGSGHVPGAVNLPVDELPARLAELEPHRNEELYVICESGARSFGASRFLADHGYRPVDVEDGTGGWRRHGYPTE